MVEVEKSYSEVKVCSKCGEINYDDVNFCQDCGAMYFVKYVVKKIQ